MGQFGFFDADKRSTSRPRRGSATCTSGVTVTSSCGSNRATMHRGRPWPAHEARRMVRTTISATEADGPETVRLPPRQAARAIISR